MRDIETEREKKIQIMGETVTKEKARKRERGTERRRREQKRETHRNR